MSLSAFQLLTKHGWNPAKPCIQFMTDDPAPPPAPTTIVQNTPSTQETSAQAIQSQIDALPKILAANQQYGDQFKDLDLASLEKYGPQYAQAAIDLQNQFGSQYADITKKQQAILNPETTSAETALKKYLDNGPDSLTAEEQAQFTNDIRASQSARGLAESGFGAQDEFAKLTGLRQQLKTQYLNTALSTAGRVPVTGGANVQASPSAGSSNLVQNVTPAETFGYQNNSNNQAASIYGNQVSAYNAGLGYSSSVYGSNLGFASALIGAGGQAGSAAILASSAILKENVTPVTDALSAIEKIEGVEYDWKQSGEHDGGVIAEQLEKVLPQAVTEVDGVKHIKPMLVIGYLIEAIKDLSAQVKELKNA